MVFLDLIYIYKLPYLYGLQCEPQCTGPETEADVASHYIISSTESVKEYIEHNMPYCPLPMVSRISVIPPQIIIHPLHLEGGRSSCVTLALSPSSPPSPLLHIPTLLLLSSPSPPSPLTFTFILNFLKKMVLSMTYTQEK